MASTAADERVLRVSNVNTHLPGPSSSSGSSATLNPALSGPGSSRDPSAALSGSKLKRLSLVARPPRSATASSVPSSYSTTVSTPRSAPLTSSIDANLAETSINHIDHASPSILSPTSTQILSPPPPISSPSSSALSPTLSSLSPRTLGHLQHPVTPRRGKSSISYSPSISVSERLERDVLVKEVTGGPSAARLKERSRSHTSDSADYFNDTIPEGEATESRVRSSGDGGRESVDGEARRVQTQTLTEKHADLLRLIAMRERRVNELRQELLREEAALSHLQSRWTSIVSRSQAYPNRPSNAESTSSLSSLASSFDESEFASALDSVAGGGMGGLGLGLGLGIGMGTTGSISVGAGGHGGVGAMITALGVSEEKTAAAIQEGKKFWGQLMKTVSAAAGGTVPLSLDDNGSETSSTSASAPATASGAGGSGLDKLDLAGLKAMLPPIPSFSLTSPSANTGAAAPPPSNESRLRPEPVRIRPVAPSPPLNLSSASSASRSRALARGEAQSRSTTQSPSHSGPSTPTSASSASSLVSLSSSASLTGLGAAGVSKKADSIRLKRAQVGGKAASSGKGTLKTSATSTPTGSQPTSPNLLDGDETDKATNEGIVTPRRSAKSAMARAATASAGQEDPEDGDGDGWGW